MIIYQSNDFEYEEYLYQYKFNLQKNMHVKLIAIWSLGGWRHAWGNHVSEGGGKYLYKENALKYFNKRRRAGSSWYLTMNVGFLIKDNNNIYVTSCYYSKKDICTEIVKDFIDQKTSFEIFEDILKLNDNNLRFYKIKNYDNLFFLNKSNIDDLDKMRQIN